MPSTWIWTSLINDDIVDIENNGGGGSMVRIFTQIIWRIDLEIIAACNSLYWGNALIPRAISSDIFLRDTVTACNSVMADLFIGWFLMMALTVFGLRGWRSGITVLPLVFRSIAVILFRLVFSFSSGTLV